ECCVWFLHLYMCAMYYVCVCVCVCVFDFESIVQRSVCVCGEGVCVCVEGVCVCVSRRCVCVCVWRGCVCVSVCVCLCSGVRFTVHHATGLNPWQGFHGKVSMARKKTWLYCITTEPVEHNTW